SLTGRQPCELPELLFQYRLDSPAPTAPLLVLRHNEPALAITLPLGFPLYVIILEAAVGLPIEIRGWFPRPIKLAVGPLFVPALLKKCPAVSALRPYQLSSAERSTGRLIEFPFNLGYTIALLAA